MVIFNYSVARYSKNRPEERDDPVPPADVDDAVCRRLVNVLVVREGAQDGARRLLLEAEPRRLRLHLDRGRLVPINMVHYQTN